MRGYDAWLCWDESLDVELRQAEDEGRDVPWLKQSVDEVNALPEDDLNREQLAADLLDRVINAPLKAGYEFIEPNDLNDIVSQSSSYNRNDPVKPNFTAEKQFDRIYGAWLGRTIGCLLGKPIEGAKRDVLFPILKAAGNYPLKQYIEYHESMKMDAGRAWAGKVDCMPEDDDTNYTLLSLLLMERYGRDFTPENVAHGWMNMFPILRTCTAERVAYKNFLFGKKPPESAEFRNPYREWIGAQIRIDFYGYINPGNPALAAEYAFRDACISHVKNGIYGAMFVAAMIAAAGTVDSDFNATEIINAGLGCIPVKSRLYKAVQEFVEFSANHPDWEDASSYIHNNYDENDAHDWCHTISNALIVCLGLLYGNGDFCKSISLAVTPLFDTDCNGATVGSIIGMICGASGIADHWKKPINDTFETGIAGMGRQSITDLAKRTCEFL